MGCSASKEGQSTANSRNADRRKRLRHMRLNGLEDESLVMTSTTWLEMSEVHDGRGSDLLSVVCGQQTVPDRKDPPEHMATLSDLPPCVILVKEAAETSEELRAEN